MTDVVMAGIVVMFSWVYNDLYMLPVACVKYRLLFVCQSALNKMFTEDLQKHILFICDRGIKDLMRVFFPILLV